MLTPQEQLFLNSLRAKVKAENIGHTLKGGKRDPVGEPEGLVERPSDLMVSAATSVLVKDIADILVKRWPGFRWAIQPNEFGGIFNVFCLDFHSQWGYVIKYSDIMDDPRRKEAYRAGRTLLDRFGYHGERYDPQQLARLPRDRNGQVIPDTSGLKQNRFTRKAWLERQIATGHAKVVMQNDGGAIIQVEK